MSMSTSREVESIYRARFAPNVSHRDGVWKVLIENFFSRWIKPDDAVLDLGAGYCEFINNVQARQRYAIDLNPATAGRAAAGVRVLTQSVTERWGIDDNSLDVVFTSNFFEHLPTKSDLHACLAETQRVLRPGGLLIAMGPNIRFCANVYWDFIDHYLPLSERSVVEACGIAGLEPVEVIPRFLPYTMAGKKPNLTLVRLYLALRPAWRLLGKQFLVVVKKAHGSGTHDRHPGL